MKPYYPEYIWFKAEHTASVPLPDLVLDYARIVASSGGGEVVGYSAENLGIASGKERAGDLDAFRKELPKAGKKPFFAGFVTNRKAELYIRNDETHEVTLKVSGDPTKQSMELMVALSRAAIALPRFEYAKVYRQNSGTRFVPEPPLSRTNHAVTVSDADVNDEYDDPDVYWRAWDKVEKIGAQRLCTRALDALDEFQWLGRTFETTMLLMRVAKLDRTLYNNWVTWEARWAPWWEYGDLNDEKAGYPALAPVGYDADTQILELTGFITKTPLEKGGPEPRRVLLRELYDLRDMIEAKKNAQGQPLEAVHVVWPERWMAQRERTPLVDCGAKVFYLDGKKRVELK